MMQLQWGDSQSESSSFPEKIMPQLDTRLNLNMMFQWIKNTSHCTSAAFMRRGEGGTSRVRGSRGSVGNQGGGEHERLVVVCVERGRGIDRGRKSIPFWSNVSFCTNIGSVAADYIMLNNCSTVSPAFCTHCNGMMLDFSSSASIALQ